MCLQKTWRPPAGNLLLQMPVIHYQFCPVCQSSTIAPALNAIDYTVSNEVFSIWVCGDCSLRFTQDVPDVHDIAPYYAASSYISHSDTNKGFVNTLYHFVRNFTLGQKRKLLNSLVAKKPAGLLDVGAGTGAFAAGMKAAGWLVTGLEPDAGARKLAVEKYQLQLKESGDLFSLPSQSFEVITLWHVLEHVHQLHQYMAEFKRLLVPGGYLILALPNYQSVDAGHYGASWAAYDVPRHLYHFSPKAVQKLLTIHQFSLQDMKPMWFDPFYISMLSENYLNGKSNLLKALLQGFSSTQKALSQKNKASSIIYIAKN
jgi:2-polyprenyl-3-methyl-5-hydroxy-6-metoxy-1,4-benzoquinol methylase